MGYLDYAGLTRFKGKLDNTFIAATEKGANSGVATLGSDGKVPSSQLPAFVDDVLEFASFSAFPVTGAAGVIYIAKDTNIIYRWDTTEGDYQALSSGANESIFMDVPLNIATTDWTAGTGVYTYTYTSQYITATCGLDIFYRVGAREALVNSDLQVDKATSNNTMSAVITVTALPVATLPLTLRIINTKATEYYPVEADLISTDAVTGADTVQEALETMNIGLSVVDGAINITYEKETE